MKRLCIAIILLATVWAMPSPALAWGGHGGFHGGRHSPRGFPGRHGFGGFHACCPQGPGGVRPGFGFGHSSHGFGAEGPHQFGFRPSPFHHVPNFPPHGGFSGPGFGHEGFHR